MNMINVFEPLTITYIKHKIIYDYGNYSILYVTQWATDILNKSREKMIFIKDGWKLKKVEQLAITITGDRKLATARTRQGLFLVITIHKMPLVSTSSH